MAKKSEIQDKLEKLKSILEFNAKISKTHKRPKSELKKISNTKNLLNSFSGKTEFFTKADKTSKTRDTLKSAIEGKKLII